MKHLLQQRNRPRLKVQTIGPISDAFKEEIERAVARMPFWLACQLEKKGWRVLISRQMLEGFGEFRHLQPRGWRKDATFNELDGCCYYQNRGIVLTEYRYDPWRKATMKASRATYIFFHEAGHAIDFCLNISRSKAFKAAYLKDVARMRRCDKRFMKYQIQYKSPAGRSEAFADLFAALMGEGPHAHYMMSWFRHTTAYIKQHVLKPCELFEAIDDLPQEVFERIAPPQALKRLRAQSRKKQKLTLLHPLKLESNSYEPIDYWKPHSLLDEVLLKIINGAYKLVTAHSRIKVAEYRKLLDLEELAGIRTLTSVTTKTTKETPMDPKASEPKHEPHYVMPDTEEAMAALMADFAAGDVDERMFRSA